MHYLKLRIVWYEFSSDFQMCSVKKGVLKNFVGLAEEYLCMSVFLIKLQVFRHASLIKETPTQFFCAMKFA